jgi:spore germination protein KC
MKLKNFFWVVICILSVILLTGCYRVQGVENKAYAVAIGIDSSDTHNLKIAIQFAVLNSSETPKSSGGASNENSSIIKVDCSTLDSGISLINSYISKQVNLSHCKAVVISEEYASNGLSNIIYTLMNNVELRPDCNIIISKCDASDFLENSKPVFESNPAKYFELNFNSSEYTGYINNITLSDFYYNILSHSSSASAILAGINTKVVQEKSKSSISNMDDNYVPRTNPYRI